MTPRNSTSPIAWMRPLPRARTVDLGRCAPEISALSPKLNSCRGHSRLALTIAAGLITVLWLALAGCGSTATGGIEGIVRIGPIAPVSQPGVDNSRPYPTELTIKRSSDGHVVAVFHSGADGTFRVPLAAGEYVIVPRQGDPYPSAPNQAISVTEGRYTHVTVEYDSGIR